jgi:8-oxo-dGTP pyrophosphatase MutT (NUDIX family)
VRNPAIHSAAHVSGLSASSELLGCVDGEEAGHGYAEGCGAGDWLVALGLERGQLVTIIDSDISSALSAYLERYPDEAASLSVPVKLLAQGSGFASRRNFSMHVTVGALLVRGAEVLLVDHLAYGILLQPGGHLEPTVSTLISAAVRELVEETGIDSTTNFPASQIPVYVEHARVPARPAKDEPAHFHLDFGYSFVTTQADVGRIQESEVRGAAWYPLSVAQRLVGHRITRAVTGASVKRSTGA